MRFEQVEAAPDRACANAASRDEPAERTCTAECRLLACAGKRRRFPVGASPTRQPLQPEATGAAMEVTKWLKPSDNHELSASHSITSSASTMGRSCSSTPVGWAPGGDRVEAQR